MKTAHYDLSNSLFTTFLDPETTMYSSAVYDTSGGDGLKGTLGEAQVRKLDLLCEKVRCARGRAPLIATKARGGLFGLQRQAGA